MADWADDKAREVCDATTPPVVREMYHGIDCRRCAVIAAALREARAMARAERAEAEMVVLRADLARAVEERDAALLLLKTLGAEHGRAWLSTASEAAFNLLRERGLLGGER